MLLVSEARVQNAVDIGDNQKEGTTRVESGAIVVAETDPNMFNRSGEEGASTECLSEANLARE